MLSRVTSETVDLGHASRPVVVIGYGGHGKVVVSALRASGRCVVGVTDLDLARLNNRANDFEILSDEAVLEKYTPDSVDLVLGIGSVRPCDGDSARVKAVEKFSKYGFCFCGFQHPTAWVAPDVQVDQGVQVHAGVIVQAGAVIGTHTILNTGCSVDHDCQIGEFCHIAPGAILSGEVKVGRGSHLGTGCVVIQSIEIGARCLVAAGATVVRSVDADKSVRGTPATPFIVLKS